MATEIRKLSKRDWLRRIVLLVFMDIITWYPEFQRPEPIQPEPIQPVRKMPEHFAGQPVVKPVDKPVARPAAKPSAKKNTESFLKEEPLKTREKIDPKKLIVYSEIMNRKY